MNTAIKSQKLYRNRDWLYQKLVVENISQRQLSRDTGYSRPTIREWAIKHGIIEYKVNGNEPYKDKNRLYDLLVNKDLTYQQAAIILQCSPSVVRTWASNLGVEREPVWMQLNNNHGKEIVKDYLRENVLLQDIAEKYETDTFHIRNVLIHNGISLKTRSQIKQIGDKQGIHRKHGLNQNYFKTWSHNMAYILGFIVADGCVYTNIEEKNNSKKHKSLLVFTLAERDREILEKIRSELEYEGEIFTHYSQGYSKEKGYKHVRLAINSHIMINDIKELGITERKTFNEVVPIGLPKEYELDFIRGFFDGDGSVGGQYPTNSKGVRTETTQIRVRLHSGSKQILEDIQSILQKYGFKEKEIKPSESIFDITYSTNESLKLYELFYENSNTLYLKRKKDKFDQLISTRQEELGKT